MEASEVVVISYCLLVLGLLGHVLTSLDIPGGWAFFGISVGMKHLEKPTLGLQYASAAVAKCHGVRNSLFPV